MLVATVILSDQVSKTSEADSKATEHFLKNSWSRNSLPFTEIKVHYRFCRSQAAGNILSQLIPVHTLRLI